MKKLASIAVATALVTALLTGCTGGTSQNAASGPSGPVVVTGFVGIGAPLADANVVVRDAKGTTISAAPATTDAGGEYEVKVSSARRGLDVVVTGGQAGTKLFNGTLRATVDRYDPKGDPVDVNEVTTLVAAYRDEHPATMQATADAAVKRYLGIPEGVGVDLLRVNSSVFDHDSFLAAAASTGFDPFVAQLAAEVGTTATRPFPGPAANGFNPAASFASGFIEEIGSKFGGMVFAQLFGDPTMDKLNQIQDQIAAMSTRLTDMTAELAGGIYQTAFSGRIAATNQVRSNVDTNFSFLARVVTDAAAAKQKKDALATATTPAAKATAQAAYDRAQKNSDDSKSDFITKFPFYRGEASMRELHLELWAQVAPEQADTLPIAFGKVLMAKHRYLTSAMSTQQQDLYRFFADYEALAGRLQVEYELARERPQNITGVGTTFTANRKAELAQMPKQLPANVILDRGSYADPSKATISSTNKLMVLDALQVLNWWLPNQALPEFWGHFNDPKWARYTGTFSDWKPATVAQIQGLISEHRSGTVVAYLHDTVGLYWFSLPVEGSWAFIWTADTTWQQLSSYGNGMDTRTYYHFQQPTREGMSTVNGAVAPYPNFGSGLVRPENLGQLNGRYYQYKSTALPVRNSGNVRYF